MRHGSPTFLTSCPRAPRTRETPNHYLLLGPRHLAPSTEGSLESLYIWQTSPWFLENLKCPLVPLWVCSDILGTYFGYQGLMRLVLFICQVYRWENWVWAEITAVKKWWERRAAGVADAFRLCFHCGNSVRIPKSEWHQEKGEFGMDIQGIWGKRWSRTNSFVIHSFTSFIHSFTQKSHVAGRWAVSHATHYPLRKGEIWEVTRAVLGVLWVWGTGSEGLCQALVWRQRHRQGYQQQG